MNAPVSARQEVEQLLAQLPDDTTREDIQYHLYVLEKIRRGRADVAAGRNCTANKRVSACRNGCRTDLVTRKARHLEAAHQGIRGFLVPLEVR